jgi:hypothetical protein
MILNKLRNFLDSKRFINFVIGRRSLVAVIINDFVIEDVSIFFPDSEKAFGTPEIKEYLARYPGLPVKIIFDTDQQYFVFKNIPKKMTDKERESFLKSKLVSDIPYVGVKAYKRISSEPNVKTDEYMLVCITISQRVQSFIDLVLSLPNPIFSFHSYSVEMYDALIGEGKNISFFQKIKKASKERGRKKKPTHSLSFTYNATSNLTELQGKNNTLSSKDWVLSLSLTETRGLRQIVSFGSSFVLNRTTYFEDLYSKATAEDIRSEIESTLKYIEKVSFLPRDKIFVQVFGSAEFANLIINLQLDCPNLKIDSLQNFIKNLRIKNIDTQYNYISVVAIAAKISLYSGLEFTDALIKRYKRAFYIFQYSKLAILIGVLAIIFLGIFELFHFKSAKEKYENLANSMSQKTEAVESITTALPVTYKEDINFYKLYKKTQLEEAGINSSGILLKISNILQNFPDLKLGNLNVQCNDSCETYSNLEIKLSLERLNGAGDIEAFKAEVEREFKPLKITEVKSLNSYQLEFVIKA